jgi:hypothetical protein
MRNWNLFMWHIKFIEVVAAIQKLIVEIRIQTGTQRDLISLLLFFQNEESGLGRIKLLFHYPAWLSSHYLRCVPIGHTENVPLLHAILHRSLSGRLSKQNKFPRKHSLKKE